MAYSNSAGYGASSHPASINYIFANSGDPVATANYFSNSEMPGYTARFYSQSQHEQFTEFRYDNIKIDYDKELKQIRDSFQGIPIEAYIPHFIGDDFGSAAAPKPKDLQINEAHRDLIIPNRQDILDEIRIAQQKAIQKEIIIEEFEETIFIKKKRRRITFRNRKI